MALRLAAQHLADPLDEVGIPCRGERGAARHVERCRAVEARAPRADRAVAHPQRRDAQALDASRVPEVDAGEQRDLFVERELCR